MLTNKSAYNGKQKKMQGCYVAVCLATLSYDGQKPHKQKVLYTQLRANQ